ncbi:MAG: hypothetical protein C4522_21015 [Desulfobacteraceae bacterium]|nr:MAG: hypothetical protein C4522_21015 [Desulfobacteraceae bacterium]
MHVDAQKLQQALFSAVSETFEAMIFTPIAPAEEPGISSLFPETPESMAENQDPDSPESEFHKAKFYQTEIRLISPEKAFFSMIFPGDLAIRITKNLYGWMEENDPPERIIQDSLSEIINTIAGKLIMILLDDQSTFTLSLPNLKRVKNLSVERGDIYTYQTVDNDRFVFITDWNPLSEK